MPLRPGAGGVISGPYSQPGRYRSGVWLVVDPKGAAAFVGRNSLPPTGTGFKYYWLGSTVNQIQTRYMDALDKLGARTDRLATAPSAQQIQGIEKGKPYVLPGAPSGILGAIGAALRAGVFVPGPGISGAAGGGEAAAGGEAATAGEAGAGGAAAGGAGAGGASLLTKAGIAGVTAAAITEPLDFLKFIAWIFHPRNILRAVEFLVGIALIIFGLQAILQGRSERAEGFATSEGALTRSGLGRVASELGAAARREAGGASGRRPQRPRSAPHVTRRRALRQRYEREERLSQRREEQRRRRN